MKIRPVAELSADPKNARIIDDVSAMGLGVSLHRFGDLSGIVWNRTNGLLVAGHQRMAQLALAGADSWKDNGLWGEIVHPETHESFRIRIVEWNDAKHRAANLVANNPAIQGRFTNDAAEQLAALEESVDYQALRLDALAEQIAAEEEDRVTEPGGGATDPDDAVEPPENPITEMGDLWILGGHRLLCGDSTKPEDVRMLMNGEAAMLMATDPPYGVDYTATKAGVHATGLGDLQERWGDIANDALDPDQMRTFLLAIFKASPLAKRAAIYVWHASGEMGDVFRRTIVESGFLVHRTVIWAKPGFVMTRSGMYHWAHEPCFYGWKKGDAPPWYGEKNQTSVWHVGRDAGKAVHPTQKPVALFEIPMANHTREGEVCYEPFSGSGSQIIAGERMKRRVFAMELSPRWVDAAVKRWEEFTGKTATRVRQEKVTS